MARSVTVSRAAKDKAGHSVTFTNSFTVNDVSTLPQVQPVSAESVRQRWRVCDHQNFPGAYADRVGCMELVAGANWAGVRGNLSTASQTNKDESLATANALDAMGGKWCATLQSATSPITDAALKAKIAWIAATPVVARVVDSFEGINEWDNEPTLTAAAEVDFQRLVAGELAKYPSLSHVKQLGGSCHDVRTRERNGIEYTQLMAINNGEYGQLIDAQGGHFYTKGLDIDEDIARRIGYIRSAGITVPVLVTECGWQQPGGADGGVKVDEATAAVYAQRAPFIAAKIADQYNIGWFSRYELLVDAQGGDFWGVIDCLSPTVVTDPRLGRKKPEYNATRDTLGPLKELGAAKFVPVKVGLDVVGACDWLVTGKTDGTYVLHLWSPGTTATAVTVTDRNGSRQITATWAPKHIAVA